MIIRHSNGDINQSVQHEPTHDPNNGQFQNLRRFSLLRLPTAGYTGSVKYLTDVEWDKAYLSIIKVFK